MRIVARLLVLGLLAPGLLACSGDSTGTPPPGPPATGVRPPANLPVLANVLPADRDLVEVWVHGGYVYTTTYSTSRSRAAGNQGDALKVWSAGPGGPVLVDSAVVPGARSLTDVQASEDGRLLIVSSQGDPGALHVFDLADPAHPRLLARFSSPNTAPGGGGGVHTAALGRVGGRLYAFLSIDPGPGFRSRLVIVDLADPRAPREAAVLMIGTPIVHDVFVRDGYLFTALWDGGMSIWDVGGGGRGGTPERPVEIGNVQTVGGNVHNIWWFHDPADGTKRYAFVGEEAPGPNGFRGDLHVVDVGDMTRPREVAFFSDPDAGIHNFHMDEARGILYAAYNTAGVRAFAVRGDLGACAAEARSPDGRCDLKKMGREVGHAPLGGRGLTQGVHQAGDHLYAAALGTGLWTLDVTPLHR